MVPGEAQAAPEVMPVNSAALGAGGTPQPAAGTPGLGSAACARRWGYLGTSSWAARMVGSEERGRQEGKGEGETPHGGTRSHCPAPRRALGRPSPAGCSSNRTFYQKGNCVSAVVMDIPGVVLRKAPSEGCGSARVCTGVVGSHQTQTYIAAPPQHPAGQGYLGVVIGERIG